MSACLLFFLLFFFFFLSSHDNLRGRPYLIRPLLDMNNQAMLNLIDFFPSLLKLKDTYRLFCRRPRAAPKHATTLRLRGTGILSFVLFL